MGALPSITPSRDEIEGEHHLGGNATLVGASANVVMASMADKSGHSISFRRFLGYGLITSAVSLVLRYL